MKKVPDQFPSEAIRKQLQQIANSEEFKKSPILAKFLRFVVETTLAGKKEEIKEYTIGVQALGRAPDFNPQFDAIVRIHATRLRRTLSEYYRGPGKNAPVVISIPKGTYIPQFQVQHPIEEEYRFHSNGTTKKVDESKDLVEPPRKPVLAVLPFHDLSAELSDNVFITALGEDLSLQLAKFDNLSVISFYTTRTLGISRDLKEIKRITGADYIITGSISLSNEILKLNVQLTNVTNSNIVWADSFFRHEANGGHTLEIIDDIISRIANNVADEQGIINKLDKQFSSLRPGSSRLVSEAIQSYFNYTYDYDITKFESTCRTVEQAYGAAKNNVLIISILSKLYLDHYACHIEENKPLLQKGMELATRAVNLDSHCQHAQKALAWGLMLSGDKDQSMEIIDNCVSINPAASSTISTLGLGLVMMGEYNRGYSLLMNAAKLDEHPSVCRKLGLSLYHYKKKNYGESSKWLDRMSPFDIPFVQLLKAAVSGSTGGKLLGPDNIVFQLNGHKKNIVERIVRDPELKQDILQAIAQAV